MNMAFFKEYENGFPAWDSYAEEKTQKLKEIVKAEYIDCII